MVSWLEFNAAFVALTPSLLHSQSKLVNPSIPTIAEFLPKEHGHPFALGDTSSSSVLSVNHDHPPPNKKKFLQRVYTAATSQLLTYAGIVTLFQKYKVQIAAQLAELNTITMIGLALAALLMESVQEDKPGDKLSRYWIPSISTLFKGAAFGIFSMVLSKKELLFALAGTLALMVPSHLIALSSYTNHILPDNDAYNFVHASSIIGSLGFLATRLWPLRLLPMPTLLLKLFYVMLAGSILFVNASGVLNLIQEGDDLLKKRQYNKAASDISNSVLLAMIALMDIACTVVV